MQTEIELEERYDIVVCVRGYEHINEPRMSAVVHRNLTRGQVLERRTLSGDLVVHHNTNRVVQGDWWLFPWERSVPHVLTGPIRHRAFARDAQAWQLANFKET